MPTEMYVAVGVWLAVCVGWLYAARWLAPRIHRRIHRG